MNRWDKYFLEICKAVASNSRCHSRQIGAILVRDHSIIATGYNGPPRGVPHCGKDRMEKDSTLYRGMTRTIDPLVASTDGCPRRAMGFASGDGLDYCIAAHAEQNCVANAARIGVNTMSSELYMNDQIPCKVCLVVLINAGVHRVTVTRLETYDDTGQFIAKYSGMEIRDFEGRVWQ